MRAAQSKSFSRASKTGSFTGSHLRFTRSRNLGNRLPAILVLYRCLFFRRENKACIEYFANPEDLKKWWGTQLVLQQNKTINNNKALSKQNLFSSKEAPEVIRIRISGKLVKRAVCRIFTDSEFGSKLVHKSFAKFYPCCREKRHRL